MYTLEIAGKAVAITNADEDQARELFMSDEFKDDLRAFTSDGAPLWDGSAPLTVRKASEDETDAFDDAMDDEDLEDEDEDDESGIDVMFLVDVDDMDDEDEA